VAVEDKSGAALVWVLSLSIVITVRWPGAGTRPPDRETMAHDKIKAAARRRMARTGESYAAARRAVIGELRAAQNSDPAGEPAWFAISYKDLGPISTWADTWFGGGPARWRIEVDARYLRLRMADFKVDVPRASVRRAARSSHQTRGTIGVHAKGGRWLANGSADGLIEIEIDPPCYTSRSGSTLFRRMKVTELIVSLVDPDGFIAALQRDGVHPRSGPGKE
jgi:hypothetical protein